jgi:hypothetical protein
MTVVKFGGLSRYSPRPELLSLYIVLRFSRLTIINLPTNFYALVVDLPTGLSLRPRVLFVSVAMCAPVFNLWGLLAVQVFQFAGFSEILDVVMVGNIGSFLREESRRRVFLAAHQSKKNRQTKTP